MPTEKKITYLLGAGASYNALPVVSEVPIELDFMMEYIESGVIGKELLKLSKTKELIEQIKLHSSIDTLARKFWLVSKGNIKDENYVRLKNLMTCLIIFKQLIPSTTLPKRKKWFDDQLKRERKYQSIDNRYDSFFASILTSDLTLPDNINIISWNYDFQIEKSLNFYLQKESFVEAGNKFGIRYNKTSRIRSKIIKLNGTGFFKSFVRTANYDSYNKGIHRLFLAVLSNDIDNNIESKIRFAWERRSNVTKTSRQLAADVIKKSDYVVTIGYSFPIFNREVDIQLFENFTGRNIYIQDIQHRVDQIKNQLDAIKTGLSEKCRTQTNTDQFLIPNEYWTNPPSAAGNVTIA